MTTSGFEPLVGSRPRLLILGTLPSRKSLMEGQYYGHPRNAFWSIMGALFGAGPELPYEQRVALLTSRGIAVWDVIASSVRPGSMDADIDMATAVPNDIPGLLDAEPGIGMICFNGQAAAKLFRRLVAPALQNRSNTPRLEYLPSTSPAYASMRFEEKLARWSVVRDQIEN